MPSVAKKVIATPEPNWQDILAAEKKSDYFQSILKIIEDERAKGIEIYPSNKNVFAAFQHCSFADLKVVIIGQDPYHGPGQAHGLSFSVPPGIAHPPSLQNIFKELAADIRFRIPQSGCLTAWADQGVLLLNTVLTVRRGNAHSHRDIGWETFTDTVIKNINEHKEDVIFLLWGSHAQKKGAFIDPKRHHILKAPHPSPLSAHRGFFGCRHFSKTNEILAASGRDTINWQL